MVKSSSQENLVSLSASRPWRFSEKYLSPSDRLSEIMYGLIMVLTVTSTVNIGLTEGEFGTRTMILAALGCNAAWGIVDGVTYVLTSLFDRSRYSKLVSSIKLAADKNAALAMIDRELASTVTLSLGEKERKRLASEVLRSVSTITPEKVGITVDEILGGFLSFLLVFLSAFVVVVPFFFVGHLRTAIRLSNLLAIGMLFGIGCEWAKYTDRNRLQVGIAMVIIGSIIVIITVALGG
jgi:VIT1/CCC1 family predicted Fe2+/Mn2+ transporter